MAWRFGTPFAVLNKLNATWGLTPGTATTEVEALTQSVRWRPPRAPEGTRIEVTRSGSLMELIPQEIAP